MRPGIAQLAASGQIEEALEQIRRLPKPSLEELTLRCELEAISANRDVAGRLAHEIATRLTSGPLAARALLVAARLDLNSGRAAEGHQRFIRARELAADTGDPALSAHAIGQHIEALLRYVSLESAVGELGKYRRAAQRAGSHASLASLHRVLAEAELKSGRGHRALLELDLAALHTNSLGDAVAKAHLDLARSAAHGLLGDFPAALEHATRGAALAKASGAKNLLRGLSLNVFHTQVKRTGILGDRIR